eukprot:TRINITY_DN1569_c0_g1_i1.p4 TRINITY_DN1569_c0_g1~~TRINITY_DN1569_c0_g1_i1.p4  ORF type:complete len:102 (-),score=6.75 TRINITY_DN1569_c0_g1_i1:429-734(-)
MGTYCSILVLVVNIVFASKLTMPRPLWKGPFCEVIKGMVQIKSRRSVVLPEFVGDEFQIHNGKDYIPVKIVEEMVGHRFGEFVRTRKKSVYKGKRARERRL